MTAGIACDAASMLSQEHVQQMFQDACNQGGLLDAAATSSETDVQAKKPKPNKNKHKLPGSNVLFAFACDRTSRILRAPKPGCSIHCSIECKPWSQRQRLNQRTYPRLSASIRQERERSEELLKQFIRVGNTWLDNWG